MLHDRDRWEKLPRWAFHEMENYERSVKTLLARVAELENEDDTTGVRARAIGSLTTYPLPKHQSYEFDLDLGSVQVRVREEQDGLWLSISSGSYQLEVAPRASNVIHVRGAER